MFAKHQTVIEFELKGSIYLVWRAGMKANGALGERVGPPYLSPAIS